MPAPMSTPNPITQLQYAVVCEIQMNPRPTRTPPMMAAVLGPIRSWTLPAAIITKENTRQQMA